VWAIEGHVSQSSCYFTSYKQHTLSGIWPSSLSVELSKQNIFTVLVVVYRRSLYAMIFLEFVAFCLGAGTLSKPV
jgi:hypothetical protein